MSKAYNVINRFSEDIDIVLSENVIGVNLDNLYSESRNKREKFIKKINDLALIFYQESLMPEIKEYFSEHLKHKLEIDLNKEELAIYVKYPTSFDNQYIKSSVKIEIGPISAWNPNSVIKLDSYIYKMYPELFSEGTYDVLVTSIERTFIEKIMILHRESYRTKNFPLRYSRHYYDVYKIFNNEFKKSIDIEEKLIGEVRVFHDIFYFRKWAQFEKAKRGTFNLIPKDEYLLELEKDYAQMLGMIYEKDNNISFNQIIEVIKEIEMKLNQKNETV